MEYTVTQLNTYIKNMFDSDYGLSNISIKGEVSNLKYHNSGHIYFTLKDKASQIACVMFAGQRRGLKFRLEEGQSVLAYGNVSIYERDGRYQLYTNKIELDGLGLLYQRYEELKKILKYKGLFDEEHKKKIKRYNKRIGIATASTGAALQDIINISTRRNPYVELVLAPTVVQGEYSIYSIVRNIKLLDKQNLDVIIVGRGGGSIEDLWAFNSEEVAYAVYECNTPIISAVGHETDTTIIDFVADLRAPTPSAAAELCVFDYEQFNKQLMDYRYTLSTIMDNKILFLRQKIDNIKLKLESLSIKNKMIEYSQTLSKKSERMNFLIKNIFLEKKHQLDIYVEKLEGLSPLNIMKKGYSYVTDENEKSIVSVEKLRVEDKIIVNMPDGSIKATITDIKRKK